MKATTTVAKSEARVKRRPLWPILALWAVATGATLVCINVGQNAPEPLKAVASIAALVGAACVVYSVHLYELRVLEMAREKGGLQ